MTLDRYAKIVLTVIALALVAIAARPWLEREVGMLGAAPALAQGAAPKYEVTIPKSWGKLVSFSNNNLLLEAPDQTMRIVDVEGRPPEFPKVKVQIHWQ